MSEFPVVKFANNRLSIQSNSNSNCLIAYEHGKGFFHKRDAVSKKMSSVAVACFNN